MRILVSSLDPVVAGIVEQVATARGLDVCQEGSAPLIVTDTAHLDRHVVDSGVLVAIVENDEQLVQAAERGAAYVIVAPVDAKELERVLIVAEHSVEMTIKRETQRRLSDRLKAIGTLAGGVGHEINNPLTYIIGNLGLITDMAAEISANRPEWAKEFGELIQEVEDGVNRIRQIVRDLKTFSYPDQNRTELVDLRQVVQATISMARNEIRQRARIEQTIDGHIPPVMGNVSQLGQVVLNLLINAGQALPVGESARQTIRVALACEGDRVSISVSDTGPGIPPDVRERIFEPFFSTKEVGVGSGLGLAMCHSIVTNMGGEISVVSEPGEGSTFTVWLPTALSKRSGRRGRLSQPPAVKARILVVDDEPGVVAMLRRALSGHAIDEATSGQEALDQIGGGEFDLVLCDLMMPGVSGIDVFERVRVDRPGLEARIAFITGGAFTPEAQRFLDDHEPPCLEKPFTMTAVRAFVDQLLSRH